MDFKEVALNFPNPELIRFYWNAFLAILVINDAMEEEKGMWEGFIDSTAEALVLLILAKEGTFLVKTIVEAG